MNNSSNAPDQHAEIAREVVRAMAIVAVLAVVGALGLAGMGRPSPEWIGNLVYTILGIFGGVLQLPQRAATSIAGAVTAVSAALQPPAKVKVTSGDGSASASSGSVDSSNSGNASELAVDA